MTIKFFADGADKSTIFQMYENPQICGFTTNPTLMAKAGVRDYKSFAREVLAVVKEKPISFEVFSDEFDEMKAQALEIASWGDNVYVKIPVTNTRAESAVPMIKSLAASKVKMNVTAITTIKQVEQVLPALNPDVPAFISLFAGRIADCGTDPVPIVTAALEHMKSVPLCELIWASPREIYNVVQAQTAGCHIITMTDDIFKKLPLLNKDLTDMSLDTVKMFYNDALKAGFKIETDKPVSVSK